MPSSASSARSPVRIPWRRLSVSGDIMDAAHDDRRFPLRCRTSLAIFYYQPAVDEALYPDSTITYLKVVCSIAGYQVDGRALGVHGERPSEWDSRVWRRYSALIRDCSPCYGALLQISVFPRGRGGIPLEHYPYITDFEPKKREMIEIVTQTGEAMSCSEPSVRIDSRGTTVGSLEAIDVTRGWSPSAVEIGNVGRRLSAGQQGEAEPGSHTTPLAQMCHCLDSYHLGGNRALFVLSPRPSVVDIDLAATGGLRHLEGIQEFFLIIEQPKHVADLRVEAQLETAHLHKSMPVETPTTPEYTVHYLAEAPIAVPAAPAVEEVNLYLTGRHLGGCLSGEGNGPRRIGAPDSPQGPADYVTFEEILPSRFSGVAGDTSDLAAAARERVASSPTQLVNDLGSYVKGRMLASVHHPDRYPRGEHSILQTGFATRHLFRAAPGACLTPAMSRRKVRLLDAIARSLDPESKEQLEKMSLSDLVQIPTSDLALSLDVPRREIYEMTLANLGVPLWSDEDDDEGKE